MADQGNNRPAGNNADDDNKPPSSAGNNTEGGSRPEPGRYRLPAVRRSQLLLPRIKISSDPSSSNVLAAGPSTSAGNDAAQGGQHTLAQAGGPTIPSRNTLQVSRQQIGARRSQSPKPASQHTTDNNPPSRGRQATPYRPRVRSANILHPFPRTVTSYRTRHSVVTFPQTQLQPHTQTETQPRPSRTGAHTHTRTRTRSRPISRESCGRTRTRAANTSSNSNTSRERQNENESIATPTPTPRPGELSEQYYTRLAREARESDARADAAASSRAAMARREEEARAARWGTAGFGSRASGLGSGRGMRWGQEQGVGDGRRRLRKRFGEREHGRFGRGLRRVVERVREVGRKVREKGRRGMEKVDRGVRWWFGA